jgi:aspartate carbamoyltransferase catalytic subunit
VKELPENAVIMHPGPMNRGVEIASDVADLPRAVITDQVTNGIAVRMSLLYLMLGGDGRRANAEDEAAETPDELQGAASA